MEEEEALVPRRGEGEMSDVEEEEDKRNPDQMKGIGSSALRLVGLSVKLAPRRERETRKEWPFVLEMYTPLIRPN
ncbi:hypothetical protein SAY87_018709 [Trapa incisa]|uniref:Uncharacterized protein n=1 Tax=Trapa incisa TaxID=236973 RepID=A0AAN7JY13_9MYRT|nr:hypothetical protein SAY87_018709 [Trapa incisa]